MSAKHKTTKAWFIKGTLEDVEYRYAEMLKSDIEIISIAITPHFENGGHFLQFILIVTYKV